MSKLSSKNVNSNKLNHLPKSSVPLHHQQRRGLLSLINKQLPLKVIKLIFQRHLMVNTKKIKVSTLELRKSKLPLLKYKLTLMVLQLISPSKSKLPSVETSRSVAARLISTLLTFSLSLML